MNKPAGVLTQKAKPEDYSLNEQAIDYLLQTKKIEDTRLFKPSVCNRLDYNTSGLVTVGITYKGARLLNEAFKDRSLHKKYLALVCGNLKNDLHNRRYLLKDEKTNQVTIFDKKRANSVPIETKYHPLAWNERYTLVEVELLTGKSHQIRADLAYSGYPIVGDKKYGKSKKAKQLLHAFSLEFPNSKKFFCSIAG
ncbi:Ribosomal large subunit pseudouridine synthase C [Lachnospiraceae bacterium TWA4]|nr:Ribosomal large subunit pseudouridine synthase C [Lachnospiraceae bacterium TWA4]